MGLGIGRKEQLIAHGRPVFVALAPVDPRSLVQGDYMRLEFAMPAALRRSLDRVTTSARPRVVAQLDARGVGTIVRAAEPGGALAPDELAIELRPKGGRWILVTDAWFFREGEAQRWQAAKFGEFRVARDGSALLVSLRGEALQPL
jgi:uncharacterized membrane-anchored protein